MQKQILLISLSLIMLFAGCAAPATPAPISTQPPNTETPTLPPTSTLTPVPTFTIIPTTTITPTPSPTATLELVNYGICPPEKFQNCPIPPEDLFNGKYLAYLQSLSKPFDPSKFKNPMPNMVIYSLRDKNVIVYDPKTKPNFMRQETAPFRRNVTSGVVQLSDIRKYIILPIEYPDLSDPTNKDKNVWVIGIHNLFNPYKTKDGLYSEKIYTENGTTVLISRWKNSMNIAPIIVTPLRELKLYDPLMKYEDPLGQKTFDLNPDMNDRFLAFIEGDTSALRGLVVEIDITIFLGISPYK